MTLRENDSSIPAISILLVDDDDDARSLTKLVLEGAGYAVTEAADGKQALALLTGGMSPRLIFLDLAMPVMSGFELLAIMKSDVRLAAIPVVVLSGDEPHEDAEARGTFVGYLKKPVGMAALLASVTEYAGPPLGIVVA
jgi:CheY-like chemotaxis protein